MSIKRTTPLPRRTAPLARGGRPRPKKRSASEFARIYGSKQRVAWVKSLPCAFPSWRCEGEIHNAHTETGGMGFKASYETIAPLCAFHHHRFDTRQAPFNNPIHRLMVRAAAAQTESRWAAFSRGDEQP